MVRSCGVQIYNKRNKSAGLGVQSSTKKITWTRSTPCSILIKQNTTINLYVIIITTTTNGNTTTSSTHHHASLWTFSLLNCVYQHKPVSYYGVYQQMAKVQRLVWWCVEEVVVLPFVVVVVTYIKKSILGSLYVCKRTNSNVLEFHHGVSMQCGNEGI